jgi:3-isopropylmalate/(R)-2-methylmalate dehydratase small subunit
MKKKLKRTAWKFGNHINGDEACQFYKNKNVSIDDEKALRKICMTGYDPDFPNKVKRGDFIVGGKNFGCGHIHAHFYHSIKAMGMAAIIAESVNPRFYREAINNGIPIILCQTTEPIKNGDVIEIDVERGMVTHEKTEEVIYTEILPPLLKEIIERGGIDNYIKFKLGKTLAKTCAYKKRNRLKVKLGQKNYETIKEEGRCYGSETSK